MSILLLIKKLSSEIQLLDAFVLKQLTEERIRAIKKEIVARDAKTLMQFLNTNYKGRFDGKLAMQIANEKEDNVMLLGLPGSGKTALAEGLALGIVNKTVHPSLLKKPYT